MLTLLVCNCSNSETKGRNVLRKANVPNYMSVPVYKGRQSCRVFLDNSFSEDFANQNANLRALKAYIANRTKFCIILGTDYTTVNNARLEWADASMDAEGSIKAESIAQVFSTIA